MDQLMDRIEKILSDQIVVSEHNGVWFVAVTESGAMKLEVFPSLKTADQFASAERIRLAKK